MKLDDVVLTCEALDQAGGVLEEPANLLVRPLEGRAVFNAQRGADHEREKSKRYEVDKDKAHLDQMVAC